MSKTNTWVTDRIWDLLGTISIKVNPIDSLSSFKHELQYAEIVDISKETSTTLLEIYGINVPSKPPVDITKFPLKRDDIIYALIPDPKFEYLSLKRIEIIFIPH